MKRKYKRIWYLIITILAMWIVLAFWVEGKGKAKPVTLRNTVAAKQILIV